VFVLVQDLSHHLSVWRPSVTLCYWVWATKRVVRILLPNSHCISTVF